jgi:hypothetical protein
VFWEVSLYLLLRTVKPWRVAPAKPGAYQFIVMSLSFRKDSTTDAPDMDYRPWRAFVSKGKSEITFHTSGRTGETRWLQVRLFNDAKACGDARDWQPSDAKDYQPGEYAVEGCLILHIMEYRKVWRS